MSSISLEDKLQIEKDFHDQWAESINIKDVYVRESFEAESALENRITMDFFGDLHGKRILDLGCGAGEAAVYFALQGAEVFATDLSDKMLQKAQCLAKHHGVEIQTFAMPAEDLKFDNAYFDCIYGSSILHHADYQAALKEIVRVIKPEGKAVFIEPLSYNPLINIYRWVARDVRTPTEVSFSLKGFECMRDHFEEMSLSFCWLTTLWVFIYMFFFEWINPSKDRYWKRIVREHKRYEKMFHRLNQIDQKLLKTLPFLKYMCWTTVIQLSNLKK